MIDHLKRFISKQPLLLHPAKRSRLAPTPAQTAVHRLRSDLTKA